MGQRGSLGAAAAGVINLGDVPYSIVGDGVADDSAALQGAIDDLAGRSIPGGEVRIPANANLGIGTSITMSSNIRVTGGNRETSKLTKIADIVLIDLSGAATQDHIGRCSFENLTLNGAANTSWTKPLVRAYYTHQARFRDVDFKHNYGEALRAVEFWDSSFVSCRFDSCGGVAGSAIPAVNIMATDGASGFGYSADNCNGLNFYDCTWEQNRAGALWIRRNSGSSRNHDIRVRDSKFEQHDFVGTPVVVDTANAVHFQCVLSYMAGFGPDYSTPTDFMKFSSAYDSSVTDLYMWVSPTDKPVDLVRTGISFHTLANKRFSVDRMVGEFVQPLSVALIEFSGTDHEVRIGDVEYGANDGGSALFSGSPAVPWRRRGTGSPEGVVPGVVGSEWIRTDGGTSTTYYVKESGTGNTGWVAK